MRKWKAYGTRCSQAVPHPSTILARRCLTSVIRRERVCSSWYGRRRQLEKSACSDSALEQIGYVYGHTCSRMPQVQKNHIPGRPSKAIFKLQIKNIKLHIVTDIKVTFNSMLGFRISIFGWGVGNFTHQIKSWGHCPTFLSCLWCQLMVFWRPTMHQSCKRKPRRWQHRWKSCNFFHAKMKSLRHQVFPGGPPSKYYPGPTMLNFRDQTRTGVFIVVWS